MFHGTIQTTDRSEDLTSLLSSIPSHSLIPSFVSLSFGKTSSRDLLLEVFFLFAMIQLLKMMTCDERQNARDISISLCFLLSPFCITYVSRVVSRYTKFEERKRDRRVSCQRTHVFISYSCNSLFFLSIIMRVSNMLEVNELKMSRDDPQEENK